MSDRIMTPEQRATVIGLAFIAGVQKELMKPGASDLEFKVAIESALEQLRSDIAAAVTPSEAVMRFIKEAQKMADCCRDEWGREADIDFKAALAAVRQELGL